MTQRFLDETMLPNLSSLELHGITRRRAQSLGAPQDSTKALLQKLDYMGRNGRTSVTSPDNDIYSLDGPEGYERLMRIVHQDGSVRHFKGERGSERQSLSLIHI